TSKAPASVSSGAAPSTSPTPPSPTSRTSASWSSITGRAITCAAAGGGGRPPPPPSAPLLRGHEHAVSHHRHPARGGPRQGLPRHTVGHHPPLPMSTRGGGLGLLPARHQ